MNQDHFSAAGRASAAARPFCSCGGRTDIGSDVCWPCWSRSQTCPACGRPDRKMARRDMCHGCYKAHRKNTGSLPPFNPRPAPEIVFHSKVDRSAGPDGCWPWTASVDPRGYGYAPKGLGEKTTHRAAWRLANGPAGGLLVCHRCDNPPCCNPSHLFLGTTQENTADRDAKGRTARGPEQGDRIRRGHAEGRERRRAHVPPNENSGA